MRERDRLRELLDAVLADEHDDLGAMARGAYSSPYHFGRTVSAAAGEPPVAMRRRVVLERAAWRLRAGGRVTDVAWEAGYDSVEGFARAYARAWGHPPSATPQGPTDGPVDSTAHWLRAPNGLHFHSPTSLWVEGHAEGAVTGERVTALMVHHDVADIGRLLAAAAALSADEWSRPRMPGLVLVDWAGPEESLAVLMSRLVGGLEVWLASIEGADHPRPAEPDSVGSLTTRLAAVAPRWTDAVSAIERRGGWADRLVDALCDPPESFVLGTVLAHVLTFDAQRRGLARVMLRQAGVECDDGDPIMWLRDGRPGDGRAGE